MAGGLVSKALVLLDKPKLELVVCAVHKLDNVPINVHGEIGNHVPVVVYALLVNPSLLNAVQTSAFVNLVLRTKLVLTHVLGKRDLAKGGCRLLQKLVVLSAI